MYYCMNRLDAEKFSNFEFAVNFGILMEVKKNFVQALHNGGGYESLSKQLFQPTDPL